MTRAETVLSWRPHKGREDLEATIVKMARVGFCPRCGNSVTQPERFCGTCGELLP